MKRIFVMMLVAAVGLSSCKKDPSTGSEPNPSGTVSLNGGSLVLKNYPNNIKINVLNDFPVGTTSVEEMKMPSMPGATNTPETEPELRGNNYRFKLVGELGTLTIDGKDVQASHVKIEKVDNDLYYAYVGYNSQGTIHKGGVAIFKIDMAGNTLNDKSVTITQVAVAEMDNAEVSAVDYRNNRLYLTGASENPNFDYKPEKPTDLAFYMVLDLRDDRSFEEKVSGDRAFCTQLTSYQGTSVRCTGSYVYVTCGDGANDTDGGLYIFDPTSDAPIHSYIGANTDHMRSVDADSKYIYAMQAEPARITRLDLDGKNPKLIYSSPREAMQSDAKSEIVVWNGNIFIAENESGLRMIDSDGQLLGKLNAPGYGTPDWDPSTMVTNSVSFNCDDKKSNDGSVPSNMLLLANGAKGVYWYDVQTIDGQDRIVPCNGNSILSGNGFSANHVASAGNLAVVADGLGGLKALYIGFADGDMPPATDTKACSKFMNFLMKFGDDKFGLFPEHKSVFESGNSIVQKLFSNPADVQQYIKVKEDTKLYLSFIGEGAGFHNSLGYFVIPGNIDEADEWNYFTNNLKDKIFFEPLSSYEQTYVVNPDYLVFKNVAQVGEKGGVLVPETTFELGSFAAGDKVVFFIVPDGWNAQNERSEACLKPGNDLQVFYTHRGFNEKTGLRYDGFNDFRNLSHNSFYSPECESIVMLFEDIHTGENPNMNDKDFNDIVISISDNAGTTMIERPLYSIKTDNGGNPVIE